MQLIKGLAYIQSTKVSRFLFSQLAKFGILIREHIASLDEQAIFKLQNFQYDFFITDYIAVGNCNKPLFESISNKFMLVYDTKSSKHIDFISRCRFIPLLAYPLSVDLIAHQILNHFLAMHSYYDQKNLALQDASLSTIRIAFNGRSYFLLTLLPDGGYLEYKGLSVKLSRKEANIMEQLSYSFKETLNSCVKFDEYSFKQITNGVSRLRQKLTQIKFPFTISNHYGGSYCLKYNLSRHKD